MSPGKLDAQTTTLLRLAMDLCEAQHADALLIMLESSLSWKSLEKKTTNQKVLLAADTETHLVGAADAGFDSVIVSLPSAPVYEKITQALLEAVSKDMLASGADVVVIYSGLERDEIDSISFISLDERLGKLSARDLRKLETHVPLETLKPVVDLAAEIGREGREGKSVGTMFVVGDHRAVLEHSRTIGFDPVKGYKRSERNIKDSSVREAVKEAAQMDGAFIVAADGTVMAACQMLETGGTGSITLSKGLGTRHWAGAAITKKTRAVAVVVSESNGTVRIFQDGSIVLRIEPMHGQRPLAWREFDPPEEPDAEKLAKEDKKRRQISSISPAPQAPQAPEG